MNFEDLEEKAIRHSEQHRTNTLPLSKEFSCRICYPVTRTIPTTFKNFWNCLKEYHHARYHSAYAITAFTVYIDRYLNNTDPTNSPHVVPILYKVLASFRYRDPPFQILNTVIHLLYLTESTNYFQ